LRVDISGTGAQQYPVAIADFSGDGAGAQIAEIIRADLTRSGQFRLISTAGTPLTYATPIAYDEWRKRGADFIA
jgi:TolB protein